MTLNHFANMPTTTTHHHGHSAHPKPGPHHGTNGSTKSPLDAAFTRPTDSVGKITDNTGWFGPFLGAVDLRAATLPGLHPALVTALNADLPELPMPREEIQDAALLSTEEAETLAKRWAEERTRSEPIRRHVRGTVNAALASVRHHRKEADRRWRELCSDRSLAPRWLWQYPIDSRFAEASGFAVRLFWSQVAAVSLLILLLAGCAFVAMRRLLLDMLGEGMATEILAIAFPTVLVTAAMGKLVFAGHRILSDHALRWTKLCLIPLGLAALLANMALIGAQQTELGFAFDLDADAFDSLMTTADPWYTLPALRFGMVVVVDFLGILCWSIFLKLKLQQVMTPTVMPTQAHSLIGLAADNASNLLAALDGLQHRLEEASEMLVKDQESYCQRLIAACRSERMAVESTILHVISERRQASRRG